MPTVQADRLKEIAAQLLMGAGATEEEAAIVARHSIGANLAGHDSHGIIQIPTYIDRVKRGHIVPGAEYEVVRESSTTTVVDGHWGYGYVVSERAMKTTMAKAQEHGVAAATVFRQSHVGRVADYPIMASSEGLIGMMTADSGRSAKGVVPFGGREARLGTNPICISMPSNLEGPMFIDMATSAVAAGKLGVAVARGTSVPEGWIIDKDGNPSTDPSDLRNGGAVLPLGGAEGHKGYGLAVMIEIFSGILTGLGFGHDPSGRHNDGCFMAAFKVDAFRDLADFKKEVTEFAQYLKETPTAKGFSEVFYPGELEHLKEKRLLQEGIAVEDSTWDKLKALADEYGLAEKLAL
ncbi:MAG: dehydrogenase [SAR202 cluster bacterium Casp-Chloro-G4]|nr:Ldh family oxidoreductase [Chloroflexota bacterium]MDA1226414.1 Ldh family oxidoreductase [Chloroflexota bacterium]PKB61207.1 MAG: dehydrogenase [SAR202 cluster bacterium Casp-Chloro-G4]